MWRNALRSGSTKMIHLTFRCIILHVGRNIYSQESSTHPLKKKMLHSNILTPGLQLTCCWKDLWKSCDNLLPNVALWVSISDWKSACAKFLGNFAIGPTKNHGICYGIHRKYHNCRVYYLPLFWKKLFAMRLPRNNFNHVLQNEAV